MIARLPSAARLAVVPRKLALVGMVLPFLPLTVGALQAQLRTATFVATKALPIASVTFRAYDLGGSLNGTALALYLQYVSIGTAREVKLTPNPQSILQLTSSAPLPNGSYGIRLDFNFASQPLTVTGTIGSLGGTLAGSCALQAAPTGLTVQSCELPVTISGGTLNLWISVSGGATDLTNVTVNQYPVLRIRTP